MDGGKLDKFLAVVAASSEFPAFSHTVAQVMLKVDQEASFRT